MKPSWTTNSHEKIATSFHNNLPFHKTMHFRTQHATSTVPSVPPLRQVHACKSTPLTSARRCAAAEAGDMRSFGKLRHSSVSLGFCLSRSLPVPSPPPPPSSSSLEKFQGALVISADSRGNSSQSLEKLLTFRAFPWILHGIPQPCKEKVAGNFRSPVLYRTLDFTWTGTLLNCFYCVRKSTTTLYTP